MSTPIPVGTTRRRPPQPVASDRDVRRRLCAAKRHGLERIRLEAAVFGAEAARAADGDDHTAARQLRRACIIASYVAHLLERELRR